MKSILAKSMSIFSFIFSLLVLVAVILIPYLYENTLIAKGKQISLIQLNNVDLWGKFPGRLQTTLRNQFSFFSLESLGEKNQSGLNISMTNQSVVIDQEVSYEKFKFDPKKDSVKFYANSIYKINKNLTNTGDLTTISQGLLEMLFSLTYPAEYQKGLNSLYLLLNKAFGTSEDFVSKLFTVYAYENLISKKEKVISTIFKNLSNDKTDLIFSNSTDIKYSLGSIKGFYNWASLVGKNEAIKNATWLSDNFHLTMDETISILGDKSFLYSLFIWFNKDLSFNFKCAKDICDSQLILKQLTDASVTRYLNIKNIKSLNKLIDPSFYPYQSSPELIEYFDLVNTSLDVEFNDINLSSAQLQKLFFNNDTTLLEPSNLIDLIYFNATEDLYSAYTKFLFKSNKQINFITGYIMEYLVNIFTYDKGHQNEEITGKNETDSVEVNSLAHGFTSILEIILNKTYHKLSRNMKIIVISKFLNSFMKKEIDCQKIILPAVDNNEERASSICSNENTNMGSYNSIKVWILPSECIHFTDCRKTDKKYLMQLTGMTIEELAIVYRYQNLGKLISDAKNLIKDTYKCGDCSSEFLARRQWFESYITKNPPKTYPILEAAATIFDWDNLEFQYPVEMNYYIEQAKCTAEDCNQSNMERVLSLYDIFSNSTSLENREAYQNRFLLQKAFSAYVKGNYENSTQLFDQINIKNPEAFFKTLQLFISNTIMKNRILNKYSNPTSLLLGNYIEDGYFLKFLANGSFYENFKPNIKSTTGFNINVDRIHKFDALEFDTGFKENEYEVRRIREFNGVPIININSQVYSPGKKDYVNKNIPLYDSSRFDSNLEFSEGFQFSTDRNIISYYDNLSSRVLRFKFSRSRSFKENLNCLEYTLTNELLLDLHENKIYSESILANHHQAASLFGKFSKPYVLTPFNVLKNHTFFKSFNSINLTGLNDDDERFSTSFICLDPFSDLVLQSHISLLYSIYTGKLNQIVQDLPENTLIPLFTHTRTYEVSIQSYNQVFPGINDFAKAKFISLVFGLIIVLILMLVSVCLCMRYKNAKFVFMGDKKLILE